MLMPFLHSTSECIQLFLHNSSFTILQLHIQDISVDVLFNGLLAKLSLILDHCVYVVVIGRGRWVAAKWWATGKIFQR